MNTQVKFEIKEKQEKIEGKNSNWGYVVCVGTIATFIAGIGHINSSGLIYKDFIDDTKSSAKSLTTAHGVFAIMLAVGGIILNITTKSIPLKHGGIIGAATFCVGSFLTITISNTNQLPLTFGLLQGVGFGMMVTVCYSTVNHYYVKKRTTVMSIIKAIQGVVLMWYPQLIKQIIYHFGFRGTLLIISGISLHTFPGILVMDCHKTRVRAANDEVKKKNKQEYDDLLMKNTNEEVEIRIYKPEEKFSSYKKKLLEILNLKVLKDPVYRNICLGQSFVNFSDLTFFILLPMLLFQYGYNTGEVAACISICAGADVAGRCLLAVMSSVVDVNTRLIFYSATLLTFILRIVILQIREFLHVAVVTAALGVFRAWLHISSPLVISNHVSHEDFPGAYALFMLAAGIVNVTCSPIVGLLKDMYEDYVPAFYALTTCCLPCLISWPVEYFYSKTFSA